MFYIGRTDTDKRRARIFNEDTLDLVWKDYNSITNAIVAGAEVEGVNSTFVCDTYLEGKSVFYFDRCSSGLVDAKTNACSVISRHNKLYCKVLNNDSKNVAFYIDKKESREVTIFIQYKNYYYKIAQSRTTVIINNETFDLRAPLYIAQVTDFGIDEKGRFVFSLQDRTFDKKKCTEFIISTDGCISCRKMNLRKTDLSIKQDYKVFKRRLLLGR